MNRIVSLVVLLNCFHIYHVYTANLPGPLVYVVTPSPRPPQIDMGRSAPFYYHKWMSRMDTPRNATPTITTTQKTKTPDLIFAEFESDNSNMKSIRNLLEKEKIKSKTTTTTTSTSRPIYVPDDETREESNYGLPIPTTEKPVKTDMTDYFALYNNLYNSGPVYVPPVSTSSAPLPSTTTPSTATTTSQEPLNNVQNIWHIIDNEKHDQYSGRWQEEPISSEQSSQDIANKDGSQSEDGKSNEEKSEDDAGIDDNFALPGFGTNPGNGAENESRAIRTEPNIRFPYIDLKPFQMKNMQKSQFNSLSNSKKGNNMFNLDSFTEIKNPVRGEVQDTAVPMRQPIDRYNPAQPYLPQPPSYGTKSKPSPVGAPLPQIPSPAAPAAPPPRPLNTISSLVPPPPPPAPKVTADDFPSPSTYESFPPYAPAALPPSPVSSYQPPLDAGPDSSDSDSDGPPSGLGYRYKPPSPPSPPVLPFVPTIPPPSKPFVGYSYNKPPMMQDNDDSPPKDSGDKPDFAGYHYSKPTPPAPAPAPPQDHAPSYGHHDGPPSSYQPESDYPELIFDKPHGDLKGGDSGKGNDMGMVPPPPPSDDMKPDSHGAPMPDHGFPHDFPGDFKYHHDFDEHDHYHYHHPTTTTTTTEMPRVNRYSYYYLGKKLYYLPLYFSVYFVIYVGALIIKAVLRHKITYPNSWRPNDQTASFFSKRSIESHLSNENLHEITGRVTRAIATAAEKYVNETRKEQ